MYNSFIESIPPEGLEMFGADFNTATMADSADTVQVPETLSPLAEEQMAAFEDQLNVLNAAYENPLDIYCSAKALIDAMMCLIPNMRLIMKGKN